MFFTIDTQTLLTDLPDISSLAVSTPDVDRFLHIADFFYNIETKQIEQAPPTCFKTYHIWFPTEFLPLPIDKTEHADAKKVIRMVFWYQAIKLLRTELMDALSRTLQLIWNDARNIIKTQENRTFCVLHTNRNIPPHIHTPIRSGVKAYTLAYCVQTTPLANSNLQVEIGPNVVDVFPPGVLMTRLAFNSELHHHGTLGGENSSNMYLWFIFDGVTEFTDITNPPTDTVHRVTYWKST